MGKRVKGRDVKSANKSLREFDETNRATDGADARIDGFLGENKTGYARKG